MIKTTENKYNAELHTKRLERIINNWDEIIKIINEELPSYKTIYDMWQRIGGPVSLNEIGIDNALFPEIFIATKDIRDKYVLSFLLWDLGVTDTLLKSI